ncbi:MAG: response regulator transcription factor [Chitinophagales bacterium]|nr:response regulator transcription factor [Chitinophagales bacterium]
MKQENILLVDDDKNIAEILEFNLKNEGFDVTTAFSAEEAQNLDITQFHLILLDVMMGGISGYKWAEQLRKENIPVPIIFLTAKDSENDMLTGFSVGGDDYIAKPFSVKEVIARVKAVIKRSHISQKSTQNSNFIKIGKLTIDLDLKQLTLDNVIITLTKTEFELLVLLAQKPDSILSRQRIIQEVWKETPYITERTIDVHITRLRKKLGKYGDALTNRSGYGYRLNVDVL